MAVSVPDDAAITARRDDAAATLSGAAPTTRSLAAASISPNTRRAYRSALNLFEQWAGGRPATDALLADYLGELLDAGRSAATATVFAAAVRFRAKLHGRPDPLGPASQRVLAGYRRRAIGRGHGQAAAMTANDLAAIVATARSPRRSRRGLESAAVAARRGLVDIALAGLLFHGGMRRAEVAALRASDIARAEHVAGGVLVHVRTSKTNPESAAADQRLVKGAPAAAVLELQAAAPGLGAPLVGLSAHQVARRIEAAGRAAGRAHRLTGHSGRVGLASGTDRARRGHGISDAGRRVEDAEDGGPLQRWGRSREGAVAQFL